MTDIQFKQAESSEEIQQIHRLNHTIFAEEIGQHSRTSDGLLIDKFHAHNRYFIAIRNGRLVGMVSVHDGPEFSVAARLPDQSILAHMKAPLEVRLLAILPEFRKRSILAGLFWQVFHYARSKRYSDLLISGIVERVPMYTKMGFRPLGPTVSEGSATFVPMRMSLESPSSRAQTRSRLYEARWNRSHPVTLLPGPVRIAEQVKRAFHRPPVSHRSQSFIDQYQETRSLLSDLMDGMSSVILSGSGTLANDLVAANLHAAFGTAKGLVLANGEFGERLLRQAQKAGLAFQTLRWGWGCPWNFAEVEERLHQKPAWIWAVHLETSTGVLNDLPRLTALAKSADIPVAADCVSSLGAVPTCFSPSGDAPALFLASGVSGKSLGSFAGLALAFASVDALDRLRGSALCPTFNLVESVGAEGPLSTISSPLVLALSEALRQYFATTADRLARFAHHRNLGRWVRRRIREAGLEVLAPENSAAPTISTFPLPSHAFPRQCLRAGFQIAHESEYLRSRAWGQIATMGHLDRSTLQPLFEALPSLAKREMEAAAEMRRN
jgi:aspartate aminotransferase-like enzyme